MKLSLAVLGALLACGTASAQTQNFTDSAFLSQAGSILAESRASGRSFQAGFLPRQQALKSDRLLQDVMVAMYDAPGTGEKIVQWLRDNKAVVEFKDGLQAPSAHTVRVYPGESVPTVYVDSAYKSPVSYRYLGVLLARESSELMLKDFPESAEKRYLVASRMAETYFELGGSRSDLEKGFDGIQDRAAADTIRIWIENAADEGVRTLEEGGRTSLAGAVKQAQAEKEKLLAARRELEGKLERAEGTPEYQALQAQLAESGKALGTVQQRIDAAEKAARQFEKFKGEEKEWLLSHYPLAQK